MTRVLYPNTTEYLEVSVTADVSLDAQPVAFSFDNATWHAAEWTGVAGTTRTARLLVDSTNYPDQGKRRVYVKVTDTVEIPVFSPGVITVY